jgi:hypothetical protein
MSSKMLVGILFLGLSIGIAAAVMLMLAKM